MKKYNKTNKKILASLAVFAVSATTVCSAAAFAGCSPESPDNEDANAVVSTISTAVGEIKSRSSGITYYVSPEGVSTNDGLSKESPKDIRSILNDVTSPLKPGDTVLVEPGTYKLAENNATEKITMLVSGEYNKYITIKNASETGEPCILDFSNQSFASTNRGVSIYGNYIYWYGIDVCGAGDNGLYIGGSFNTVEYCDFYNNRDTGLQLGRSYENYYDIDRWPSYNLIKNCTSHNNYDNETYGENADGFAAKLTVGYGNVFDGCIAYRNSDDGWDLYAKTESGNIGTVIMYNCVAYENGFIEYTQDENNARFKTWTGDYKEEYSNSYLTRDGDGNGFKLGGSTMEGDVLMYNCLSFNNRMHGVTDNSNPGVLSVKGVTSYNNGAAIDNTVGSPTFGKILDVENGDTHANIDLSRQSYSYNNISHVLSVGDSYNNYDATSSNLSSDALRGSSIDSVLFTVSSGEYTYYALEGANDVQSKVEGSNFAALGTKLDNITSEALFKKLPFTKSGSEYTFNITGARDLYADDEETTLNPNRAHLKYRNADGSVNMGDLLAKKDGVDDALLIVGEDIGSTLNKESFDDYEHFYISDFVDNTVSGSEEATVKRAAETLKLTLTCDPEAVYQDFDLVNKMINVSIKWESSDESLLVVDDSYVDVSVSQSEYIKAIVYRDPNEDKTVTLTAYLTCGNAHETVDFELTIKQGIPKIGNIYVTTRSGDVVNNGGTYIVDQYAIFRDPVVSVENGIDYNGKTLDPSQYTVETSYSYKVNKNESAKTVAGFTPSVAGVYSINHRITLNDTGDTGSMVYTVYVVSPYADVAFVNESGATVTVNRYGYILSGEVTNASGQIYAVSSSTELTDISEENIKTYAGVKSYSFRADNISFQFENENTGAYYIYYVIANSSGKVTSELYTNQVSVTNISSEDDFMKMVNSESSSSMIYLLTKDLDFSSKTWTNKQQTFKGLFNGAGHTIKGITATDYVFYKVNGGTLMNVKFVETNITSSTKQVGLISECDGGYFYNIQFLGLRVSSSDQRVGGLIGLVGPGSLVSIDQVAVDNSAYSDTEYYISSNSQRAGGLIGLSQASNGSAAKITIEILNSYVNAYVRAPFEVGGFFGTYDGGNDSSSVYNLTINNCIFTGKVEATGDKSYAGGILGYHKGGYANMTMTNSVSIGEIWFNHEKLIVSLKNASLMVGCSTDTLEGIEVWVRNCYALMEEYNTSFDVTVWDPYSAADRNFYINNALFSEEKWSFDYDKEAKVLNISLLFLD